MAKTKGIKIEIRGSPELEELISQFALQHADLVTSVIGPTEKNKQKAKKLMKEESTYIMRKTHIQCENCKGFIKYSDFEKGFCDVIFEIQTVYDDKEFQWVTWYYMCPICNSKNYIKSTYHEGSYNEISYNLLHNESFWPAPLRVYQRAYYIHDTQRRIKSAWEEGYRRGVYN